MNRNDGYLATEPRVEEVLQRPGRTLLEFGAPDCGICIAAQPMIGRALAAVDGARPLVRLRIHDGAGQRLGRHFGVKLWPTLVLLHDGEEMGRLVRPTNERAVAALLAHDQTKGEDGEQR